MSKSLSKLASVGGGLMASVVVISKIASFLGQWVLGLYLLPEDFAVIAVISIATLFTAGFSEVGLNQKILSSRNVLHSNYYPLLYCAQLINMVGVCILCILAPIMSYYYSDERLLYIIIGVAVLIPIQTLIVAYRARMNIHLKFKVIAKIESIAVVISNCSLAFFAYKGLSVYSYLISQVFLVVSQLLFYRYVCEQLNETYARNRLNKKIFFNEFQDFKWLSLTSYSQSLSQRGDYLASSIVLTKVSLGMYYFGFQLVASVMQLVSFAINSVLYPILSKIHQDKKRSQNAFKKSVRVLSFITSGLCIVTLVLLPFVINLVWNGKWNEAIVVCQMILLAMPLRIISNPLGASFLDACGRYREKFFFTLLDGVSVILMVYLGAYFGQYIGAAVMMAIQRMSFGSLLYFYVSIELCGWRETIGNTIKLMLPFYTCVILLFFHHGWGYNEGYDILQLIVNVIELLLLYVIFLIVLNLSDVNKFYLKIRGW